MAKFQPLSALPLLVLGLFACGGEDPTVVAGGASETEATIAGYILGVGGKPATGIAVRLRPTYFLKDPAAEPLPKGPGRIQAEGKTDDKGYYAFDSVFLGDYSIEASQGDSLGVRLLTSVTGSRKHVDVGEENLRPLTSLRGHIVLPPGSAGDAFVQVFGLERYGKMDSTGAFVLPKMPQGTFALRITPTSTTVSARSIFGVELPSEHPVDLGEVILPPSLNSENYSAWKDSARIFVNTTGITGTVTGFPLLVRLDRSNFDFTLSTGLDLRFANAAGAPLPYELERWNPLEGKAEIWVRADTLRGKDNTQFLKMYWNRPGAPGLSGGATVFDSTDGYQGVWHLQRDPANRSAIFQDASAEGNHARGPGLDSAGQTAGTIQLGQELDGKGQYIHTSKAYMGPDTFTLSLWFKTTTTSGGRLAGFSSQQTGMSYQYDRHLWMDNQGKIHFGVYPPASNPAGGVQKILSSAQTYNDGNWHSVAARLSAEGQILFLDGVPVTSDPEVQSGYPYPGFWRFGYETMGNWAFPPSSAFFQGSLDEIRVGRNASSDAWIKLSHENQKPGSTIVSVRH